MSQRDRVAAEELAGADILVSTPMEAAISRESFPADDRLVAVLRLGVGYEDVDVAACTANDVALVIPPEAVRRPTAVAALTLMLAVTTRLLDKHKLSLEGPGAWPRRPQLRGFGLTGRTLGLVGVGNIGGELARLVQPLDIRVIAHDPFIDAGAAERLGVRLTDLDTLLREADVVSLHCPLRPETRGLINGKKLALMKPTAFLINTSRGPVVDQRDLIEALRNRRIAGAGLDVFDREPLEAGDPLTKLDNVVLSAHALNWTDQLEDLFSGAIADSLLAIMGGREPRVVVNREVLTSDRWRRKLAALGAQLAVQATRAMAPP
jgi:phosphoglycerate dehydrogenase-like enzyme